MTVSTDLRFDDGFTDCIEQLLTNMREKRQLLPLLLALGCRRLWPNLDQWSIEDSGVDPSADHEDLVIRALLEAIKSDIVFEFSCIEDSFALLDGLAKNDRWRSCLSSVDNAYEFIGVLLELSFQLKSYSCSNVAAFEVVSNVMVSTLNIWLCPETPFDSHPNVEDVAIAMFGTGWLSLIDDDDIHNGTLIHMVRIQRPPFLPGLIPSQQDAVAEILPDMETP